jgi:hypothetical protein
MECPQPERPELNYRSCEGHFPAQRRDIRSFGLAKPRGQDLCGDAWESKSFLVAPPSLSPHLLAADLKAPDRQGRAHPMGDEEEKEPMIQEEDEQGNILIYPAWSKKNVPKDQQDKWEVPIYM